MSDIYIIRKGLTYDAEIMGVTLDEEIAEAYAKLHKGCIKKMPLIEDRDWIQRANNAIYELEYTAFIRKNKEIEIVQFDSRYIESKYRHKEEVIESFLETLDLCRKKAYKFYTYVDNEEDINVNYIEKMREEAIQKIRRYVTIQDNHKIADEIVDSMAEY